jgi:hypothetical protein
MTLTIDERHIATPVCAACGRTYQLVTGFVLKSGDAHAIYFAACHRHLDQNEVWMDVALGSWEDALDDQETFACRVRPDGAALVQPFVAAEGSAAFFGQPLNRDEALVSARLNEFWNVVDLVVIGDDTISAHLSDTD